MATELDPPSNEPDLIRQKVGADVEVNGSIEATPSSPVVYTMSELAENPHILHDVVSVINGAYLVKDEKFGSGLRFPRDQDLIEQFGEDALCSVIRAGNKIIATASIQKWREPEGSIADISFKRLKPDDYHLMETGRSYEVKAVATLEGSVYRQKGFAPRCMAKLEELLLARVGGDFLLWIHTAEYQNGPYWRRRGFENILVETKPIGYWGAYKPFDFVTGVKRVSQRTKLNM